MNPAAVTRSALTRDQIRERVEALAPWFHNLDLDGVATAPSHFLGDYPLAPRHPRRLRAVTP
jgi:hypothetical protein